MIDMYLKFTSEAAATKALEGYDGSVDTIGVIYKRTGGTDEEPVMTALSGWHVNVRGPESKLLAPFKVQVATPYRVWA
jgi:hypothetical protein